ncbi:flagellar biosynthesis anti-sigma factor FlgM [Bowmanella sp. Y26]|uniref:flagellar biosynthesis anti-sigma factor FlgM n=1 Tax=Bowmanella yangjiangensis TaxID=2811230 RepID=UPI001BDCC8F6|nr:flagellar biosynthesis anti-sigma factor FlgM [Bowmanella yangjiangensis]MBT1064660.1 flagellar biosynthesis anti-sigma factor FlgM [Bowmanella yangjiangensis]
MQDADMLITPYAAALQSDTAAATSGQVAASQRQDVSTNTPNNEDQVSLSEQSKQQAFMQSMLENMLAKRLGIDKEKIDELKEKIQDLEDAIDGMKAKGPLSAKQQDDLNVMEQKLDDLKKMLEELIREAAERAAREERKNDTVGDKLAAYKSIFSLG